MKKWALREQKSIDQKAEYVKKRSKLFKNVQIMVIKPVFQVKKLR